jgi:hypothetical protein
MSAGSLVMSMCRVSSRWRSAIEPMSGWVESQIDLMNVSFSSASSPLRTTEAGVLGQSLMQLIASASVMPSTRVSQIDLA